MNRAAPLAALFIVLGIGCYWLWRPIPPPSPASLPIEERDGIRVAQPTALTKTVYDTPKAPLLDRNFEETINNALASLPTIAQLRELRSSELHRTPKAVVRAGDQIGLIAEAIEKNPALAPQGMAFYGKCARKNEISSAIRALCLGNLRDLARNSGAELNEIGVSEEIRRLADKLTD